MRSMTLRSVCLAMAEACAGVRLRSKMSVCASSSTARSTTSSSLPLPSTNLRIDPLAQLDDGVDHLDAGGARELAQLAHALVGVVVIAPCARTFRRRGRGWRGRPWRSTAGRVVRLANSSSSAGDELAEVDVELRRDDAGPPRGRAGASPSCSCVAACCTRSDARAARRRARAAARRPDRGAAARGRRCRRASAARRAGACAPGAAPRNRPSAARRRPMSGSISRCASPTMT